MRRLIAYGGAVTLLAFVTLAVTQAPLGTPLFFACAAVPCVVYALLLIQLLGGWSPAPNRLLIAAMLLAVAFRVPLAVARVGSDSDMVRYLYDGRLQQLGYNPFSVLPSDPAVAATHTDDTRRMPSRNAMTPYPAAAQLFFRLIVSIHESRRLMKLALVYAWNPLVVLEVAHSGHIDALGALWLAISAWMLSTGRGMRAMVAFVIAVATKLLPIVLVPLYWRRVRIRDAVVGALVLAALYFPFRSAGTLPLGAVPNVIEYIRFNGPLFKLLASIVTPQGAAAVAVLAGLTVAAWFRARTSADDPAA